MLWSDLATVKTKMDIDPDDQSEDKKLLFFLEEATRWLEELCDRDFSYKTRTQFYKGTGTQKLMLRARPVFPAPVAPYSSVSVWVDEDGGFFGQDTNSFQDPSTTALTYGQDYTLQVDQDDGSSRSGILIRINEYWPRPRVRQAGLLAPFVADDTGSIKVTYTAGYTVDTLPAQLRLGCDFLIAKLRTVWPLGVELAGESYEDRSISTITSIRSRLLPLVAPFFIPFRNFKW